MSEERLNLTQAKLISNLKKSLPPSWKITYKNHSGELSIFVHGPTRIFIDRICHHVATVIHYQEKRYILFHFQDNIPTTQKDLVRDGLKTATKFLICEI